MKYIKLIHRAPFISHMLYIALFLSSFQAHSEININIGVRAHSGHEIAINKWTATAQYLNKKIPGYNFIIRPIIEFDDMKRAVENSDIDFVLTNPAA